MLKTSSSKSVEPKKGVVGVGGNSKTGQDGSKIDDNKVNGEDDDKVGKKCRNLFKSKNLSKSKKTELSFLTSGARIAFSK